MCVCVCVCVCMRGGGGGGCAQPPLNPFLASEKCCSVLKTMSKGTSPEVPEIQLAFVCRP